MSEETITLEMRERVWHRPDERASFLKKMPEMTEWVEKMEAAHGPFMAASGLILDRGRAILAVRFERVWYWSLTNPENGEEDRDTRFCLTPEAMCGMVGLFDFVLPKEQRKPDWDALEASLASGEVENREEEDA